MQAFPYIMFAKMTPLYLERKEKGGHGADKLFSNQKSDIVDGIEK